MRNFIRAMRFAWPYRFRIGVSFVCALLAAVLWSLNFTAIYPILKIFTSGQNLQTWINASIETHRREHLDPLNQKMEELQKKKTILKEMAEDPNKNRHERQLAGEMSKVETELAAALTEFHRLHVAKRYIDAYCPT